MAEIPASLPLDAPQGASMANVDEVRPADFGAGQAAQELSNVDVAYRRAQSLGIRAQAAADKQSVAPIINQVQEANQADLKDAAAAYTPGKGGLTTAVTGIAQDRAQRFLTDPSLSVGQRSELQRGLQQETLRVSSLAADHQSSVDASQIAAATQAQTETQVGGVIAAHTAAFAPARDALYHGYADGETDLPQKVAAAYDAASTQATAAAPPAIAGTVGLQLAAGRNVAISQAQEFQTQHAWAGVTQNVSNQVDSLVNTVTSSPGSYQDAVDNKLPTLLAPLGGGQIGDEAKRAASAKLAEAHIQGLLEAGQSTIAKQQLDSGQFDQFLPDGVKERLEAGVDAAVRGNAPMSVDQALAQADLKRRAALETNALLTTGKSTGQVTAAEISGGLPLDEAAQTLAGWTQAQRAFATDGPVRGMASAQLTTLAASSPDPTQPGYQTQLMQRQAAVAELQARQTDPGGWAFASNGKGVPAGATGAVGLAQDRGAALQGLWQQAQEGQPHAMGQFVGSMIGSQARMGIPRAQWAVVPNATAQQLAASVTTAPADQRGAAMSSVAALFNAMPASFRMPDGSFANPRAIFADQLLKAKLTPVEMAAIVDHGSNPAALGQTVAALADPNATKKLPGTAEASLQTAVAAATRPYLATTAPTGDAIALNQGRGDLTALVARHLVLSQGLSPQAAAQQAAGEMASGYRFTSTFRIPTAVAGGLSPWGDGQSQIRQGAGKLMGALTANDGALLYQPQGQTRQAYAMKVQANAHWITAPDDSGLMLMNQNPGGNWDQVADRYGRPVTATWDQLKAQGSSPFSHVPAPFATPPASVLTAPDGQPAPAASKAAGFAALSWGITKQESGFRNGLAGEPVAGPNGTTERALGLMQVLPSAAGPYAQRIFGQPLDTNRLQNDADYNTRIGNAILADNVNHFGATPGGLALATAAYFAGQGNVEGYTDKRGYHPGFTQTIGDPRSGGLTIQQFRDRLPPKTQHYLDMVLPAAAAHLSARG